MTTTNTNPVLDATSTDSSAADADADAAAPAVSPVPAGYTTLTPYFCVDGAEAAIAFYETVLGARVVSRNDTPDGKVAHCELALTDGRMQLSDPAPDHHLVAATGGDDVSRSTVAYLPDVDAAYERAVASGAKGYGEPSTFVTGDRYAAFLDPWGHRWAIMTRVEAQRRVDAWVTETAAAENKGS
jgi:uncharacterized glyoxalase superfamily protein PhnB